MTTAPLPILFPGEDDAVDVQAADIVDETIVLCGGNVRKARLLLNWVMMNEAARENKLTVLCLYPDGMDARLLDSLSDALKQARSATEDCFMSLETASYPADTQADICRLLDEAVANLDEALKLAHAETS